MFWKMEVAQTNDEAMEVHGYLSSIIEPTCGVPFYMHSYCRVLPGNGTHNLWVQDLTASLRWIPWVT
jgi:hypothetical protein